MEIKEHRTLVDLKIGEKGIISKVKGRGAFRKRIIEMGFVVGQEIKPVRRAPMHDPIEYNIMNYEVSLRNSEAELIEVISPDSINNNNKNGYNGMLDSNELKTGIPAKSKVINIALVGNPNCGKTTIFNHASGSKERVGNYSGVTIDAKTARFKHEGYIFNIVDLPGTYSISAYSPEELYVRDYIIRETPDVVLNVLDSSNLERNLYLTTELIDLDIKVVVALNMYDELNDNGDDFNYEKLGRMLGIPFIPTVASKGVGLKELFTKIIDVYHDRDETVRHIHINYGFLVEKAIRTIQDKIKIEKNFSLTDKVSSRFLAIKLLQNDPSAIQLSETCANSEDIINTAKKESEKLEKDYKNDSESIVTESKYGFLAGALKETFKKGTSNKKFAKSQSIDKVLTHKFWGIPLFLFFMWLTFYITFTVGEYPMNSIEYGVESVSEMLRSNVPEGMVKDLVIDGIIGGVGGVIVFLPNIVLLYLFISLMEDTGYMARAVFIMDKAMHKIGLHGKSFIPLLMGFGCNVPAILSSRIIESPRDRLVTILINPFMSCSARLPVYVLFISAFFVHNQASILFMLYITGILLAIISAMLFKKTVFKTIDIPFVMELPPYRIPTIRSISKHMWFRASQYLKKVGGIILLASVVIWALGYFPREVDLKIDYDKLAADTTKSFDAKINSYVEIDSPERLSLISEKDITLKEIELMKKSEKQELSYIGQIGSFFQPIMDPLGFDWKMTISLLTGIAAKEIVVGTLGVLYHAEADADNQSSLVSKLQQQTYKSGEKQGMKVITPPVALAFMFFILIYFPCMGVVAAIKKESGGWKWALFSIAYTTFLAWGISLFVYNAGKILLG